LIRTTSSTPSTALSRDELFAGRRQLLDLTPKGRDEDNLDWPMAWLHRPDVYPGDEKNQK